LRAIVPYPLVAGHSSLVTGHWSDCCCKSDAARWRSFSRLSFWLEWWLIFCVNLRRCLNSSGAKESEQPSAQARIIPPPARPLHQPIIHWQRAGKPDQIPPARHRLLLIIPSQIVGNRGRNSCGHRSRNEKRAGSLRLRWKMHPRGTAAETAAATIFIRAGFVL